MRLGVRPGDESDVRSAGEDFEEALDAGLWPELGVVVHIEEEWGVGGVDDDVAAVLQGEEALGQIGWGTEAGSGGWCGGWGGLGVGRRTETPLRGGVMRNFTRVSLCLDDSRAACAKWAGR